jgi:glycosyltransferase involved in cell wall biosynthesis
VSRLRPRLAYFSPLPPAASGIADYSRELLPHLARVADVTFFAESPQDVSTADWWDGKALPLDEFPARRWAFDLPLYQMGNSQHHAAIYKMLCRYPGVMVLHDFVLHHMLLESTVGVGDHAAYSRELAYELGQPGHELARRIRYRGQPHPLFDLPLNRRAMDASLGIIVHSRYVARLVEAQTGGPVYVVPALADITEDEPAPIQPLNLPLDTLLVGSFGQITAAKRLDQAFAAFRQLLDHGVRAHYLLVGGVHPEVNLAQLLAENRLEEHVTHLGRVADLGQFRAWINQVDIVINLRQPTAGETSATALRALAAAKPLIVYDLGWYSELPDDVCLKLPPLDNAALFEALLSLANQPERRQALGQAARQYAQAHHHPAHVAGAYLAAITGILERIDAR